MKTSILAFIATAEAWSFTPMQMKTDNGIRNRRDFLSFGSAIVAGGLAAPAVSNAYKLPDLPYPYEELEPFIDTPTMKLHHDKHHATYVANINKATEGKPEMSLIELQTNAIEAGVGVRNNGGGHYNHAFFWDEMTSAEKAKKTKVSAELSALIDSTFGSMDDFKAKFEAAGAPGAVFGSGWVWLCVNQAGDGLQIIGTPNQDNPLMKGVASEIMFPILGVDVWEHAYYLKYQNRRPEYLSNWWNVVNWDKISDNFAYVVKNHAAVPVSE